MTNSLRVALLCEFPTLNGGERSLLSVIDALRRAPELCGQRIIAPIFVAPPEGPLAEEIRARGLEHVAFAFRDEHGKTLPREVIVTKLESALAQGNPDLLHANSLSMARLSGALAVRSRAIHSAHLRDIVGLSKAAVAEVNGNRRLVAVSQATRAFHVGQGVDAGRTIVIHNGVDLDEFRPRPRTGFLREELGLPKSAMLTATIGQIGLRKGQNILAEAAERFLPHLPEWHCLIIGERHSGKEESLLFERQIAERFRDAGFENRLRLLGYRSDMVRLMSEIDLLIHPARQEPLGRVLLESAASGVPIVATDVGGTSEILENGVSARLVPPDDPQTLAAAVLELGRDDDLRERLASAARVRMENGFDVRTAAATLAAEWNALAACERDR